MCVVSNVGDHYGRMPERWPWTPEPYIPHPHPPSTPPDFAKTWREWEAKREEAGKIEALEDRIKALEELLAKAKKYDEEHGEPNCEMDEKVELLKKLARQLGVEINLP